METTENNNMSNVTINAPAAGSGNNMSPWVHGDADSSGSDGSEDANTLSSSCKTPYNIFQVEDSDDDSDDDSVEELLAVAYSLINKPKPVRRNYNDSMDKEDETEKRFESGEKYKGMSDEDFLRATEETMAQAREAHMNHLFRVTAFEKRWNHVQQPRNDSIPKRQDRTPRFYFR